MLSMSDYVNKSLETNLFFLRIMREHLIFITAGLPMKEVGLMNQATQLRTGADQLLNETIRYANGVVSQEAVASGEFVTNHTLPAEQKVMALTGIPIDTTITQRELNLAGSAVPMVNPQLAQVVSGLNQGVLQLVNAIIAFKQTMINEVSVCRVFTWIFPTMLEHVLREAQMYATILAMLQNGQNPESFELAANTEAFWDNIMHEHAEFTEHYLDPTEKALIGIARGTSQKFIELTGESAAADRNKAALERVTRKNKKAVEEARAFNEQGTELLLNCKIRSLLNPLLTDHLTREASHFRRLLYNIQKSL